MLGELSRTRARIAALQAQELTLLARADAIAAEQTARVPSSAGREREMPLREMAAEVAAVMRRSDRVMQQRLHDATVLVTGFAATVGALRSGAIDTAHVRIIQDAGARITDPDARARFEQAALVVCERETPGRAKPIIAMIAQKLHPVPLAKRHAEAVAERRVWVRDLDDGMAELAAVLPAVLAYAIRDRLTQHAREVAAARGAAASAKRGEGGPAAIAPVRNAPAESEPVTPESGGNAPAASDPTGTDGGGATEPSGSGVPDSRTTDQVRADVFTDLLLTGHAGVSASCASIPAGKAITAHVQIVIPDSTLTGTGTAPAELVGYGPIDPETARRLAARAAIWERVFLSPTTGAVHQVDAYRPTTAQRRHLDARDEHCRFPGCRRTAHHCDHDHTVDHARGGPTALTNLANLCTRHHTLKHASAWSVTQSRDGTLQWVSPTGETYPDIPRRVLEFSALQVAAEAAPF
ncbi:HNH endonuclease [Microbacterium sp. zg.Y1090]|uniref:HNH endonuclease signature motif containing protein n=1 Tax=Microbacterium TaxID=33882 RepID=UPI00214B894F|nr:MULTISPECIES: HNH endonuclease signature motif containing protein [unclassified Microbacterium]MCR2811938.1 HNH endonuclease [Microbacterium sp. zg.Y1084]MCR2818623.1 HNH endonuclease [Microbacterium sp. zg.Y1090]MDL5486436.1 DUF222 domain-containing protein [Microbacterium sp. zg-Y1211]WIM29622.1 DUF222 domain-containing protein [Microbacterium sp. zg-Y1090]